MGESKPNNTTREQELEIEILESKAKLSCLDAMKLWEQASDLREKYGMTTKSFLSSIIITSKNNLKGELSNEKLSK